MSAFWKHFLREYLIILDELWVFVEDLECPCISQVGCGLICVVANVVTAIHAHVLIIITRWKPKMDICVINLFMSLINI